MEEEREKEKEGKGGEGWGGEGREGEGRESPCVFIQLFRSSSVNYRGGKRERERREGEGEVVPNGVLIPVLLACFPSMPSSVCERKWEIAQNNHTHAGIGD